jgi:hypothetical protein
VALFPPVAVSPASPASLSSAAVNSLPEQPGMAHATTAMMLNQQEARLIRSSHFTAHATAGATHAHVTLDNGMLPRCVQSHAQSITGASSSIREPFSYVLDVLTHTA